MVVSSGAEVPPVGCNISGCVRALAVLMLTRIPAHALETIFGVNEDPAGSGCWSARRVYLRQSVHRPADYTDGNYVPGEAEAVEGNPIELHQSSSCNDPNQ